MSVVADFTGNVIKADGFDPSVVVDAAAGVGVTPEVLSQDNVQDALEALATAVGANAAYTWVDQADYTETESIATVKDAIDVILAALAADLTPVG